MIIHPDNRRSPSHSLSTVEVIEFIHCIHWDKIDVFYKPHSSGCYWVAKAHGQFPANITTLAVRNLAGLHFLFSLVQSYKCLCLGMTSRNVRSVIFLSIKAEKILMVCINLANFRPNAFDDIYITRPLLPIQNLFWLKCQISKKCMSLNRPISQKVALLIIDTFLHKTCFCYSGKRQGASKSLILQKEFSFVQSMTNFV